MKTRAFSLHAAFFFLLLLSTRASAQEKTFVLSRRQEVNYSGVMGAERSFAELYDTQLDSGKHKVTFVLFDHRLAETKRIVTAVPQGEKLVQSYTDSSGVYAVYAKKNGQYTLVYCNGTNAQVVGGSFGRNTQCMGIKGCGGRALVFVAERINNYLLIADFSTGKTSYVFLNKDPKTQASVVNISYLPATQEFSAVYLVEGKTRRQLHVLFFDQQLTRKNDFVLSDAGNREQFLLTAAVIAESPGNYFINGSYQDDRAKYPDGVYAGKFINGTWQVCRFYSFATGFAHFTDHLPERKAAVRRQHRALRKGKKYRYEFLLLPHAAVKINGTYVCVAEIYAPQYTHDAGEETGGDESFSGYLFPEVIVAGFDDSLSKKWDESFPLDILSPGEEWIQPEKVVRAASYANELVVLYSNGSQAYSIGVDAQGNTPGARPLAGNVSQPDRSITGLRNTKVRYWFGSSFLATGTAREKNKEGRKEKIFYLRLLSFGELK